MELVLLIIGVVFWLTTISILMWGQREIKKAQETITSTVGTLIELSERSGPKQEDCCGGCKCDEDAAIQTSALHSARSMVEQAQVQPEKPGFLNDEATTWSEQAERRTGPFLLNQMSRRAIRSTRRW